MQESFTPSAFGEKWSMTRMCMENKNAHTSTSRSPFSDGEFVCNAQKVKTDQCHCNSSPDEFAAFFAKKQTDDRYNYDITGGNKSGFSDSGIFDAKLLEVACKAEQDTTADTAGD